MLLTLVDGNRSRRHACKPTHVQLDGKWIDLMCTYECTYCLLHACKPTHVQLDGKWIDLMCTYSFNIVVFQYNFFITSYMWAHVFTHTHCTIRIAVITSTRKITFLVLMAGLFVKSNERTYMKLLPEVCLGLKAQSHIPLRTSNAQKMKNFGQCVVIRWACVRIRRWFDENAWWTSLIFCVRQPMRTFSAS